MLRFAIDLMLRVCVANLYFVDQENIAYPLSKHERRSPERACEDFRHYLSGATIWPGKFFPMRLSVGSRFIPSEPVIWAVWDHYLTRGVDGVIVIGDGTVAVYAHLPFHVFWTQVLPRKVKDSDWPDCRIRKRGAIDPSLTQRPLYQFWSFLNSRLAGAQATFAKSLERTAERVQA